MIIIARFPQRYCILLILVLPLNPLWAGDETMFTPYTQIDPETGFAITIEQPATGHALQNTGESVANMPVIDEPAISPRSAILDLSILIGIAIFIGGLYFRYRKSRQV